MGVLQQRHRMKQEVIRYRVTVAYQNKIFLNEFKVGVDGGKNTSQQRGSLPILQVPIRLTNVWYGRPDRIMHPLQSK